MNQDWITPLTLTGKEVELISLKKEHDRALVEAASDGKLWELWYTSVPTEDTINDYIQTALKQQHAQASIPFSVVQRSTNTIIGSTRYCNIDHANRRLEIGYTWYAQSTQRTGINTECKYLLLRHAFEMLDCIAVEFRTHWLNHRSRNAILRLGAKQDGVLRNHRIDLDGAIRDTVVFSILNTEWKTVKKGLEFKMNMQR